jgi:ADP-dependent NAD(P)H-hydrate dehydratase / NAD(P)H-hydrate epimerase
MLAVVGTVPDQGFPLVAGIVSLKADRIYIQGHEVPVNRGTPALLAAAIKTAETLGGHETFGYLVGDIGLGDGSRRLYEYITNHIKENDFSTIAFHYVQPDVDWHNKVLHTVKEMTRRPVLIADAGFMYAAKMSGMASEYDFFTPDVGELAFLADEDAPHPFYTRGFILHEENRVPDMIARAYSHKNASRFLLVKGKEDYVADQGGIRATVKKPAEEALEAIGGTGDIVTGIASALISADWEIEKAAVFSARANRLAGHFSKPTPATQVIDIINNIPWALAELLSGGK